MKVIVSTIWTAALAVVMVSLSASGASAGEGCAEKAIRARAAELGGYEVTDVKAVKPGVLVAFKKPGETGVVIVGMAAVEPDLVTSQSAWGREGGSALTAEESAWLGRLFEKLYPDAEFRACPELGRKTAPTADETFAAMQAWWKELNNVTAETESSGVWFTVLWIAVAVLFIGVVVLLVIVRTRTRKPCCQPGVEPAAVAPAAAVAEVAEPRAETPGDEPDQPDEPEEVL